MNKTIAASLVLAAFTCLPVGASTLFQTTGNSPTDTQLAFNTSTGSFIMESFGLSAASSVVSIYANLSNPNGTNAAVDVLLTNQVGTGTTSANQIGGAALITLAANSTDLSTLLFSNITLAAGTYFLVFQSASTNLDKLETSASGNAPVTASGVTAGKFGTASGSGSYAPSSTFTQTQLQAGSSDAFVTIASTPEPTYMAVLGLGLVGIGWRSRGAGLQPAQSFSSPRMGIPALSNRRLASRERP